MKAHGGNRIIAPLILNLGCRWRRAVAPAVLPPRKKKPVTSGGWMGPSDVLGILEKWKTSPPPPITWELHRLSKNTMWGQCFVFPTCFVNSCWHWGSENDTARSYLLSEGQGSSVGTATRLRASDLNTGTQFLQGGGNLPVLHSVHTGSRSPTSTASFHYIVHNDARGEILHLLL
jgi:hypothetical protein